MLHACFRFHASQMQESDYALAQKVFNAKEKIVCVMIHLISVFSDGAQDAVSISSMINPENKLECESSSESGTFSVDSIIEGPTK